MQKHFVAIAFAFAGAAAAAHAQEAEPLKGVIFAGGSISNDASAYAGVTTALPGAQLGKGLALRFAANGGEYEYAGGPGQVSAQYYGASVALTYQTSGSWGWANISAGPSFTQTDLEPADPGNMRAGSRFDAVIATDGALTPGRFRLAWYAEGGVRDESYMARIQATRSIKNGPWRVGVEVFAQGDPNYDRQGAGGVVAWQAGKNIELQLSGGVTFQKGRKDEPYVSLSFSKLF